MPKILIIDDSPSLTGFLRDIFLRKGYVVHASSDPVNGMLLFKNQRPDMVFAGVDVRRPEGWSTVEKLRQANAKVPVAVMSNAFSKEAEEKGASLGCVGFVFKELKPEAMLQKVLDLCSAHAPLSREGALEASKGRILIVDDEEVIRTVLKRFLKGKGYDVVTAANGREALERVKKDRPHLMLLDIRMPEMDGFEVLRQVHDIDREIAVMMITANTDLAQARKTMEMGACDYIVKPFHLEYLETTVMAKLLMVTA